MVLIVCALGFGLFARANAIHLLTVPAVTVMRLPNGGIQPQTAVDRLGATHMIYFTGDPSGGNIEYVTREPGARDFSAPIRVNSQPGSAISIGTVRGPQMALGREGQVFVVWMGSKQAEPTGPNGTEPLLFSRLEDPGTLFSPQRNLIKYATGLNGGLSVAADHEDNVYVMWHATGEIPGEANRRVYLTRSSDDGRTFARENAVSPAPLGACGCCGMRGFADSRGTLYILYRAAAENVHRDMTLLISTDHGKTFRATVVGKWQIDACPMSTNDISGGRHGVLTTWETAGEVYFDEVDPRSFALSDAFAAPGRSEDRKHPAVAANAQGQVLLTWTEGTAWSKGGSLAWQLFDNAGHLIGPEGHAPNVPVWGLPSIVSDDGGNFTIFY